MLLEGGRIREVVFPQFLRVHASAANLYVQILGLNRIGMVKTHGFPMFVIPKCAESAVFLKDLRVVNPNPFEVDVWMI